MKSQNEPIRAFTGEELEAMRNHAEDDRRLLFLLLTSTGRRASDAIDVTWGEAASAVRGW